MLMDVLDRPKNVQTTAQLYSFHHAMHDPWAGKIPWRRERLPISTPVFLSGEFHGLRSLVGYSPWGRKESETIEYLTLSFSYKIYKLRKFL